MKDWKKEIFTIPNLLSIFRLILIPVYITIYLNANDRADYYIAAGILAVSCLTDMIDGKIARHFNMITNIGKMLDPIADKATQITLILCLVIDHPILWVLVGMFVIKETFQIVAGGVSMRKGRILKGALISGKVCTTVLFVSLILMVMIPTISINKVYIDRAVIILVIINAVCMVFAFAEYVITYLRRDHKFQSLDDPNNP